MRLGTRYEAHDSSLVLRVMSRIVPPILTVTDFEEGRRFAVSLSRGATSLAAVYALETVTPTSTNVTRSLTFDSHGIWRLLELLLRRRAVRGREAEVENLKRILETQRSA
jgi:hypothetical protein